MTCTMYAYKNQMIWKYLFFACWSLCVMVNKHLEINYSIWIVNISKYKTRCKSCSQNISLPLKRESKGSYQMVSPV